LESVFNVALPQWHAETQRCFALEQCNKAIGLLRHVATSPPPAEVVLMSCILFITFEYLDNRCEVGMDLLHSGLELLQQWRASALSTPKTQSEIDMFENHLAPVFARCKLSVVEDPELDIASLKVRPGLEKTAGVCPLALPHIFLNLEHARNCLQALIDYISASVRVLALEPNAQLLDDTIRQYQGILQEWRNKFATFSDVSMTFSRGREDKAREFLKSAILLNMHCHVVSILLATAPFAGETLFDDRLEDFKDIISLSREFIALEERHKASLICNLSVSLSFSFDLGIISPLWLVGGRCRDPFVRREAINLLYLIRRREGVWSSLVAAMVLEKIMLLEECGLQGIREARDIPSAARIRLLGVHYQPGRAAGLDR
jgi:hypothetical protein